MITSVVLAEEETEETTSCEGCQASIPMTDEFYFSDYHGGREDGYYCDDCIPRCYCKECDPDYFNDILFDR